MYDCIFCKIIKKEINAKIIYENDKVIAFNDINPVAPVHVLIVSKIHIANVKDLKSDNANILIDIHMAANKIANDLGILEDGYRLITSCGPNAGQTVFHLHYHQIGGMNLGVNII